MAQLNEYGKEFQHCHLGRRGTVHSPISRRVIEDKTYQKRPPKFTPEMEVDYQNYKEAARSSSNMQSQYQKILKTYGGFQRMTEDQHREVLELYSGPFDEQLKWVERSPMAIACHLEIAYRAGFLEKYPYACATYGNAVNHQTHVESLLRGARDRVEDHKRYIRDLARRGADT